MQGKCINGPHEELARVAEYLAKTEEENDQFFNNKVAQELLFIIWDGQVNAESIFDTMMRVTFTKRWDQSEEKMVPKEQHRRQKC